MRNEFNEIRQQVPHHNGVWRRDELPNNDEKHPQTSYQSIFLLIFAYKLASPKYSICLLSINGLIFHQIEMFIPID
ncbi:MAG: hypothetical protein HC773_02385 [Scytonema sp. CRU_2_7]|nr:hypothetical protein [Scytonema sp. CRU_2_7]